MLHNLLDLFAEGKEVVLQQLIHWRRCSYRLFIVKIILFWRSDTVKYFMEYSWLLKVKKAKIH